MNGPRGEVRRTSVDLPIPDEIIALRNSAVQGQKRGSCTANGGYPMMFDPRNARQEFEKFLSGRNLNERNLNLANGCEAFFDFYRDSRPRGRVPSSVGVISLGQGRPFEQHWDADRLLAGENFYLNLSRNLVLADDDAENEPTWQLRLTFEFEQNNDLRALGLGDRWAGPLSELPHFRAYVYRSPVFTTCSKQHIHRTTILQFEA
jgi:hypothetical protein